MGTPWPSDVDKGVSSPGAWLWQGVVVNIAGTPQTSHPVLLLWGHESRQLLICSQGNQPTAGTSSGSLDHSRWVIPVFLTRQGKKIKSPSEQCSQAEPGNVRDVSVNPAAEASGQAGRQLLNY